MLRSRTGPRQSRESVTRRSICDVSAPQPRPSTSVTSDPQGRRSISSTRIDVPNRPLRGSPSRPARSSTAVSCDSWYADCEAFGVRPPAVAMSCPRSVAAAWPLFPLSRTLPLRKPRRPGPDRSLFPDQTRECRSLQSRIRKAAALWRSSAGVRPAAPWKSAHQSLALTFRTAH